MLCIANLYRACIKLVGVFPFFGKEALIWHFLCWRTCHRGCSEPRSLSTAKCKWWSWCSSCTLEYWKVRDGHWFYAVFVNVLVLCSLPQGIDHSHHLILKSISASMILFFRMFRSLLSIVWEFRSIYRLIVLCLLDKDGVLQMAKEFGESCKYENFVTIPAISKVAQIVTSIPDKAQSKASNSLSPQYPYVSIL